MRKISLTLIFFSSSFNTFYNKIENGEITKLSLTRKHLSRMRTDRAVTRLSSEPVSIRPIVDRQTPVKTFPSLAVSNNWNTH